MTLCESCVLIMLFHSNHNYLPLSLSVSFNISQNLSLFFLVSIHDCHYLQLCSPAISGKKRNPLNLTCSLSQSTHAILDFHSSSERLQLPNLDSLHNSFFSHYFLCVNNKIGRWRWNNSHPQHPALVSSSNSALRRFPWLCCSSISLLWVVSHWILLCKALATGMVFSDCDVWYFMNNWGWWKFPPWIITVEHCTDVCIGTDVAATRLPPIWCRTVKKLKQV